MTHSTRRIPSLSVFAVMDNNSTAHEKEMLHVPDPAVNTDNARFPTHLYLGYRTSNLPTTQKQIWRTLKTQ